MSDRHAHNLHQHLQQLIAEACSYPPKSWQRRRKINQIVQIVTNSGKLWRENTPYYNDALQQTWLYFCRNLEQYNPAQGSVITWLDNYLKWRLQDYRQNQQEEQERIVFSSSLQAENNLDPIDNLPASPDVPLILEETYKWVNADPDGELTKIHAKGYPHLTCQVLILRRLPPETPWKAIAQEFGVPLSTAANFYKRECLPRLRKFAQNQGYLE
ncbi:hypothetical protein NIES2119_13960 [[Phormidium ambiguum] IAM M-71]|uniref:Sigma-70 family RNA polymerase sigma factor n=1 Tax=[Phormidium ambiguum] IAM M-71 TaxID=454136 RepID=A0A1U7IJV0_9CYAN|nr:hypothetical protein [Phormidium ambiguum]OKH37423.1 hypothetical protein NIES2119_13960 [Phormidium ambiguum IAM M-71]